jgi:hypothetical protein
MTAPEALWTETKPVGPGVYRWRKDCKWEPVEREVRRLQDGSLVTYSHRFANWVDLKVLDSGGSEWFVPDLLPKEPNKKCPVNSGVFAPPVL